MRHPNAYAGARFALLTKHCKEFAIAPVLEQQLEASLEVIATFDTDSLGTFTRKVPRPGSQVETAARKARIAIEESGASLGLGSEGTFGPGPFGFGSWNTEVIVLVDVERNLEVVGRTSAAGHHHHASLRSIAELVAFADRCGFPSHGLTMRPNDPDDPRVATGLQDHKSLTAVFERAVRQSESATVWVESDLRAHMNPTRMATIRLACIDLVARLRRLCPHCGSPGFGLSGQVFGRPCAVCAGPTHEVMAERFGCVACDYEESVPVIAADSGADPKWCDTCNP